MELRSKKVLRRKKPKTDSVLGNRDFSDSKRYLLRSCKKEVSEGEIEVFADDNLEMDVKRGKTDTDLSGEKNEFPGERRLSLRSWKKGISEGEIEVFGDDSGDNLDMDMKRGKLEIDFSGEKKEFPGERRLSLRSCKKGIREGEIEVFTDNSNDNLEMDVKGGKLEMDLSGENNEFPGERRLSLRSGIKGIREGEIEVFVDNSDDNLEMDVKGGKVEMNLSDENKEFPGERRLSLRSRMKGISEGESEVFADDSDDNLEGDVKRGIPKMDSSVKNKAIPGERRLSLRSAKVKFGKKGVSEVELGVCVDACAENLKMGIKEVVNTDDKGLFLGSEVLDSVKDSVVLSPKEVEDSVERVQVEEGNESVSIEVLDPVKDLVVISPKEEVEDSVEPVQVEEGNESVSIEVLDPVKDSVVISPKEVVEDSVERVQVEEGNESVSMDLNETGIGFKKEAELPNLVCENESQDFVIETFDDIIAIFNVNDNDDDKETLLNDSENANLLNKCKRRKGEDRHGTKKKNAGKFKKNESNQEKTNVLCGVNSDDGECTVMPLKLKRGRKRKNVDGSECNGDGRVKTEDVENYGVQLKRGRKRKYLDGSKCNGDGRVKTEEVANNGGQLKRGRKSKNVDGFECNGDGRVKTEEVETNEVQVSRMMLRSRSLTTASGDVMAVDVDISSGGVESSQLGSIGRLKKKFKRRGRPPKVRNETKDGNPRPMEKRKRLGRSPKGNGLTSSLKKEGSLIEKPRKKLKRRGRPPKMISPEIPLGRMTSWGRRQKVLRKEVASQAIQKKRLRDMVFKKINRRKRLPKVEAKTLATHVIKMRKVKPRVVKKDPKILKTPKVEDDEENEHMMYENGISEHMERGKRKQLIRDKISDMLLNSGWVIELRQRQQKAYQDAVYVEPNGRRSHWSITRAYFMLKKKVEDGDADSNEISAYSPIPSEEISMLFRKVDKELGYKKKKNRIGKNVNRGKTLTRKKKKQGKNTKNVSKRKVIFKSRGDKFTEKRKAGLLARDSVNGAKQDNDALLLTKKRNLLSWMIDLGVILVDWKVKYGKTRRQKKLFEGAITCDGICCGCCNEVMGISEFVGHCGGKTNHPFDNVYLESGTPLRKCLMDSWRKEEESSITKFGAVDVKGDDPNDDTCNICGDGGNLICCDGCPSTFHQSCLDIQNFPSGEWNCIYCSCKFCGVISITTPQLEDSHDAITSEMLSCCLCEQKFHRLCSQEVEDLTIHSNILPFCGRKCQELFERLQKCLGVKHELEDGFSWTLLQRSDVGEDITVRDTQLTVERNSKLAVAYSVMDECFMPIVDERSGINVIRNVVYNCGSNFKRLNYAGFLTAVLEKGDELVTAASIRINGYRLAEMPFIGTRHMYRRQGMCRRLLDAIESCLNSLGVEELIIPAIPELLQTWTKMFGFVTIEESKREAMKCMNMMVFPGIDMLTKPLLQNHSVNANPHLSAGLNSVVSDDKAVECTTEINSESISQLETVSSNPIDYQERSSDSARAKNVIDHEQTKEASAIVDGCSCLEPNDKYNSQLETTSSNATDYKEMPVDSSGGMKDLFEYEQTEGPTMGKDAYEEAVEPSGVKDVIHPENDELVDSHGANSLCDLNFPATNVLPCDTDFQTSHDSDSFPSSTVEPNSMDSVNCGNYRSPELVPRNTFDLNLHPTVAETDMHIVSDDSQACTKSFEIFDSRSQVDHIPSIQPDAKSCERQTLVLL
uniref:uncharacterized protein LOC122606762 n=1 Tax=Erigeron canadensis TaxID=72917 RepID=UPI001CB98A58|nr:uncharacterized protein LOC122606762 [Erigeron canadensis]